MINKKREQFIKHYIRTLNATESAKLSGYSQKTAYSIGQHLLKIIEIKEEIDRALKQKQEAMALTDEGIIERLWKEANNALRSNDRTSALSILAKIRGLYKDNTQQSIALFGSMQPNANRINAIGQQA